MYIIKGKILKGGVEITSLNIEKELDKKTISILLENKTIIKSKKKDGDENAKREQN